MTPELLCSHAFCRSGLSAPFIHEGNCYRLFPEERLWETRLAEKACVFSGEYTHCTSSPQVWVWDDLTSGRFNNLDAKCESCWSRARDAMKLTRLLLNLLAIWVIAYRTASLLVLNTASHSSLCFFFFFFKRSSGWIYWGVLWFEPQQHLNSLNW